MTSYSSIIEAKILQNDDVHFAQIPDFEMEYRIEVSDFSAFFTLFHLSLTFFRSEFPFKFFS